MSSFPSFYFSNNSEDSGHVGASFSLSFSTDVQNQDGEAAASLLFRILRDKNPIAEIANSREIALKQAADGVCNAIKGETVHQTTP